MVYIRNFMNGLNKAMTKLVVIALAISMLLPTELATIFAPEANNVAQAFVAGVSGSIGTVGKVNSAGTGIINDPIMRIGLSFGEENLLNDSPEHNMDNIYKKNIGIPSLDDSIFMLDKAFGGSMSRPVSVGYYNGDEFSYSGQDPAKLIVMNNGSKHFPATDFWTNNQHGGIFFEGILADLKAGKNEYFNGGFKTKLKAITPGQISNCKSNWSYILKKEYGKVNINAKIDECFGSGRTYENMNQWKNDPEAVRINQARYLDMLWQIWALAPTNGTLRTKLESAIETIMNGEMSNKPFSVIIESAVMVINPADNANIIMSTNDFLATYAKIDTSLRLNDGAFHTLIKSGANGTAGIGTSYMKMYRYAVDKSVEIKPNLARFSGQTDASNPFSWAVPGMLAPARYISTRWYDGKLGENPNWATSTYKMHLLLAFQPGEIQSQSWDTFGDNSTAWNTMWGFNKIVYLDLTDTPELVVFDTESIKGAPHDKQLKPIKSVDGMKDKRIIGDNIQVTIYPDVSKDSNKLSKWLVLLDKTMKDNDTVTLNFDIARRCHISYDQKNITERPDYNNQNPLDIIVDGVNANSLVVSALQDITTGLTNPLRNTRHIQFSKTYNRRELKDIIVNNKPLVTFTDKTSNIKVNLEDKPYTIMYGYNLLGYKIGNVVGSYTKNGLENKAVNTIKSGITLTWNYGSFLVPAKEKDPDIAPVRLRYASEPTAYAELKNYGPGSTQTKPVEEYEVMAGVPTTEQLYYAAGGSEFIVDVSLEYVKDEEAVRSYASHYDGGVDCEFKEDDSLHYNHSGWLEESQLVPAAGNSSGNWTVKGHTETTEVTAEWKGTIANEEPDPGVSGKVASKTGSPCDGGTGANAGNPGKMNKDVPNWNVTNFNTALDQAKAFANANNGKLIIKTGKSDAVKREYNIGTPVITSGWGTEHLTTNSSSLGAGWIEVPGKPGVITAPSGCGHSCTTEWDSPPVEPDEDGKGGSDGVRHSHDHSCGSVTAVVDTTTKKEPTKDYTITVTFTKGIMPAHAVCGPCCSHVLPAIDDTWSQSWKYDTMKITDVHIWEINRAAASGLESVIGPAVDIGATQETLWKHGLPVNGPYKNPGNLPDGIVGAQLTNGKPSIFYNIAMISNRDKLGFAEPKNPAEFAKIDTFKSWLSKDGTSKVYTDKTDETTESSLVGRVRYSIQTNEHDQVYYYNGARTNQCDGMADTYKSNVKAGGGKGHAEKWADGFIYNSFIGTASNTGSSKNDSYAGQRDFPLNTINYLQNHCDGVDQDYATFSGKTATSDHGQPNGSADGSAGKNYDFETTEYKKFKEQRTQPVQATMITDFLILKTTSGDQSVMYFQADSDTTQQYNKKSNTYADRFKEKMVEVGGKKVNTIIRNEDAFASGFSSIPVTAESKIPELHIMQETMWDKNPLSAAKWKSTDINIGGYNGKYTTPGAKFNGTGNGVRVTTIFDNDPAYIGTAPKIATPKAAASKIVRPADSTNLMLISNPLNIIMDLDNKNYLTNGVESEVFWANLMHWSDKAAKSMQVGKNPLESETYQTNMKKRTDKKVVTPPDGGLGAGGANDTAATGKFDFSKALGIIGGVGRADETRWGILNKDATHSYMGHIVETKYSDEHGAELNALIIQDPVSSENVGLESIDPARDQRYSKIIDASILGDKLNGLQVCPKTVADCEFAVLDCKFDKKVELAKFTFDNGTATNATNEIAYRLSDSVWKFESQKIHGTGSTVADQFCINMRNDMKLDYQPTVRLQTIANVKLDNLNARPGANGQVRSRISQPLFSFDGTYANGKHEGGLCLYVSTEGKIGFIEGGSGQYRESVNRLVNANEEFVIDATFSFKSLRGCEAQIGRINTSTGAVTWENIAFTSSSTENVEFNANSIGEWINIGAYKDWSFRPEQQFAMSGYLDNVIINRESGTLHHTDECYIIKDMHPSGQNAHIHNINCLQGGKETIKVETPVVPGDDTDSGSSIEGEKKDFSFTGKAQSITLQPGKYRLETWGAQGGDSQKYLEEYRTSTGGYSQGIINLSSETTVYVYVGGKGTSGSGVLAVGGFNGGGKAISKNARTTNSGGGGTDIRIGTDSLYSRVIVAGGGGGGRDAGSQQYAKSIGASAGGGESGIGGTYYAGSYGTGRGGRGGSQTSVGRNGDNENSETTFVGGFGFGGYTSDTSYYGVGGGGGWYGGGTGSADAQGGGGSGYVCTSTSYKPSGYKIGSQYYLTDTDLIAGNATIPAPSGGTETGHAGNGYARITSLQAKVELDPSKTINRIPFTGKTETMVLQPGVYKFETWGAEGGGSSLSGNNNSGLGGKGGYSVGTKTFTTPTTVYINTGGCGGSSENGYANGGFNGGGSGYASSSGEPGNGGGGATDIRVGGNSLSNRIVVAGGGGGGGEDSGDPYGHGGGLTGVGYSSYDATQSGPGSGGSLGQGGSTDKGDGGGGGGGYYGGGTSSSSSTGSDTQGGGGGSGYVGGVSNFAGLPGTPSAPAVAVATTPGNASMPSPFGSSRTETGHSGNGYAKITRLTKIEDKVISTGYDKYKELFEQGKLTTEELKKLFGDAYETLFIAGTAVQDYRNFADNTRFRAPYNCTLKPFSGNMVQSITGTAPHFRFKPDAFNAKDISKVVVTFDNNTSAKTAKMWWSNNRDGNFSEKNQVSTIIQGNTANQTMTFYPVNKQEWDGQIQELRFDIPSDEKVNYNSTIVIKSISIYSADPAPQEFLYTGGRQTFTAPIGGYYNIQAWGASGGNREGNPLTGSRGGLGGYSKGAVKLAKGETLEIYVGGQGRFANTLGEGAGFNGGGSAGAAGYGGGGMTHITKSTTDHITSVTGGTQVNVPESQIGNWTTPGQYEVTLQPGTYRLETWGAQGSVSGSNNTGGVGYGGYSEGEIRLNVATSVNIYVGGRSGGQSGGYNGGGIGGTDTSSDSRYGGGGGGATDIRLGGTDLENRVIVAGGGGGSGEYGGSYRGSGGGEQGLNGHEKSSNSYQATGNGGAYSGGGGNQSSGGLSPYTNSNGIIGIGGSAWSHRCSGSGGGGGGYYGGAAGYCSTDHGSGYSGNGGGGSGYVGGVTNGTTTVGQRTGNGMATITRLAHTEEIMTTTPSVSFNTDTNTLYMVAGGGGGADNAGGNAGEWDDGSGGDGGGQIAGNALTEGVQKSGTIGSGEHNNLRTVSGTNGSYGGTQNGGYKQGLGESVTVIADTGGAGGGYWGGLVTNHYNGGGGGGSGFINPNKIIASHTSSKDNKTYTSGTETGAANGNVGNGRVYIELIEKTDRGVFPTIEEVLGLIDMIPDDSAIFICDRKPNTHICDANCTQIKMLNCTEPHHSGNHYEGSDMCYKACMDDEKHKTGNHIDTTTCGFEPGNFLNLDYGYRVYYDNRGDFKQSNLHGMGSLTNVRGMGYENNMDTFTWTRNKRIRFDYNVIHRGILYRSGEWITLGDKGEYTGQPGSTYNEAYWTKYNDEDYIALRDGSSLNPEGKKHNKYYYDFYCVEANNETNGASTWVESFAINNKTMVEDCGTTDQYNKSVTNRTRIGGRNLANHSTFNMYYNDIVGRIGSLVMLDTADYRFSNLFKEPVAAGTAEKEPIKYQEVKFGNLHAVGTTTEGIVKGEKSIQTMNPNSGATMGSSTELQAGKYKIYVHGSGLLNSRLSMKAKNSWETLGVYDATSGMMHKAEENKEVGENGVETTNPSGVVTGPSLDSAKAGQYKIKITGMNLLGTDWQIGTGNKDGTTFSTMNNIITTSDMNVSNEVVTFTADLKQTVNGLSVRCSYAGKRIALDNVTIYYLNTSDTKDIARTKAVSNVVTTGDLRVYHVNLENTVNVEISALSTGLPIGITKIGVQELKESKDNNWIVEGIIGNVDLAKQRAYLTYKNDIRGIGLSGGTGGVTIDTYSTLPWAKTAEAKTSLPLTAAQNNVDALKHDSMVIGYDSLMSIQTLGRYFMNGSGFLQVIPEYYAVRVKDSKDGVKGSIEPVDLYVSYNNGYYPINIWGLVTGEDKLTWGAGGSGYNMNSIYNMATTLDWNKEAPRRMYSAQEKYMTGKLKELMSEYNPETGKTEYLNTPAGSSYVMGNPQFLQLNGKARTFIGGEATNTALMNKTKGSVSTAIPAWTANEELRKAGIVHNDNGRIVENEWWMNAQRWHFTISAPSSTEFIRAGKKPVLEELNRYKNNDYVIISTVDIRALGEIWNLRYTEPAQAIEVPVGDKSTTVINLPESITIGGANHKIPVVINVYSPGKTPKDDIDIESTH